MGGLLRLINWLLLLPLQIFALLFFFGIGLIIRIRPAADEVENEVVACPEDFDDLRGEWMNKPMSELPPWKRSKKIMAAYGRQMFRPTSPKLQGWPYDNG